MERRQQIVVWIWIAAVVAAGLFPPWTDRGLSEGYHSLFGPPHSRMHIDQSRLMLEWLLTSVLAAGTVFAWPERGRSLKLAPQTPPAVPEVPPSLRKWMNLSGQKWVWDGSNWVWEQDPNEVWPIEANEGPGYVPRYPPSGSLKAETPVSKLATHRDALVKLAIIFAVLVTLLIGFLSAARMDRGGSGRAAPQGVY